MMFDVAHGCAKESIIAGFHGNPIHCFLISLSGEGKRSAVEYNQLSFQKLNM